MTYTAIYGTLVALVASTARLGRQYLLKYLLGYSYIKNCEQYIENGVL